MPENYYYPVHIDFFALSYRLFSVGTGLSPTGKFFIIN